MKYALFTLLLAIVGVSCSVIGSELYRRGFVDKCYIDTIHLVGMGRHQCECVYEHRAAAIDARSNDITAIKCMDFSTGR